MMGRGGIIKSGMDGVYFPLVCMVDGPWNLGRG